MAAIALLIGPSLSAAGQSGPDLDRLVAEMTLEEKVGQLALRGRGSRSSYAAVPEELVEAVRAGRVGGIINLMIPAEVDRLQRIAVEESPRGIPLLFGRDVIHGLHAVQPIPLAQAATWDPALVEEGAREAAIDAGGYGINWTFAPMLDLTRDPRWGRIAESTGEDPVLGARMAEAMVRGIQGGNDEEPTGVAACVKHFAGYGAAEGGRDYNTASMSRADLHNFHLPPFAAAIGAGAASAMSGFHDLNGLPATAHPYLLDEVLRGQWGFEGFVVSDWNSVVEMIAHGVSEDARSAARQALLAGLDMEMMSTAFEDHLIELVQDGEVSESDLDRAVLRILRVKEDLGLFEGPHRIEREDPTRLRAAALEVARRLATESAVLLRNNAGLLPLSAGNERIAVIGPLADAPHEQLGTWAFDGRAGDSRTPLAALRQRLGAEAVLFARALRSSRDSSTEGFPAALAAAEAADVVLFFGGEEAILSGEAHSRADLALPGAQPELLRSLAATGKPIVLVILAGRPLTIHDLPPEIDAVLMAWHPGTMAGPALADLLLGAVSPSGRLPVTWPRSVGQIPIYYNHKNTGRPAPAESELVPLDEIPTGAWQSSLSNTSRYLDLGTEPEFPFGFGLTYTTFEYSDLELSSDSMTAGEAIEISATVTNTGPRRGSEVVQLYTRDLVGSRTRPVRELEAFRKLELEPGASTRVSFTLRAEDLRFHDGETWILEPGRFEAWIAPNATSGASASFELGAEPEGGGRRGPGVTTSED